MFAVYTLDLEIVHFVKKQQHSNLVNETTQLVSRNGAITNLYYT